ncbi:putative RNA polymerase ECF family sigma factor [Prevotella intermedia]|uniref:Putative RNA polymerase ECF family sigma factor n=1 Tax=Prevotella intermedia TaxID=28131 RepID=A0A0S3UKK3_PREIN|nr:sigma-70 family RNA polymerase sigma factor [Prevotella intermedia]BAU17990.1 putative RNA polymerase ECF family sigma factor [Prevotella intermedia]
MKKVSFRNDVLPLKNQLFRLALRITLSREEAEDIVQDTMIKVWDKRYEWSNIDSIEAYSLRICRNLSLDRLKKRDNQNDSFEEEQLDTVHTSTPQDRLIDQDRLRVVKEIVDSLPEKQRSCMQLRDFEGKQYKEIADILGITEEQVKVNIFRARQVVKQRFQKIEQYGL